MRDIDDAIIKGIEIIKANEDLDLDVTEAIEFYERFLERVKTKPPFDAVSITVHDAFLVGLASGIAFSNDRRGDL